MQPRTVAAAAAAVAVVFAATGCNILTPQATTIQYDPSDGISGSTGTVRFHNAMLIGEPEGDALNLVVTFTNEGEATFVEVRTGDETQQIRVAEGITIFGPPDEEQLVFDAGDVTYGALQNVSFQADGAEPTGVEVQLISSDFIGYETLAPEAAAD
ncbi:hypothetical protein [Agrococcus citreus]|uniref:DNA modification methylase n=1 Tax=Agrococcus citreus TaxID=84643 RepID=A0ABN1YTW6_9MICO